MFVGSDSGLLIPYLEARIEKNASEKYLIVEEPAVLAELADKVSIQSDNIIMCTLDAWSESLDALGFQRFIFMSKVRLLKSFACMDSYAECYQELFTSVESSFVRERLLIQASTIGSRKFLELQLINVPDYQHPATEIVPVIQGRDVLILAGGPSLENLQDWLITHREHFIIIAVTRVAGFLKILNIKPDYYITVDPNPISFSISRDALAHSVDVPLIASNHANETLVSNWISPVYTLDDRLAWLSDLNLPSLPSAMPTVTHSAILVALEAKARRIFMAGMDLCYGKGHKSHVIGTAEAANGPKLSGRTFPVKTYSGAMAETDSRLLLSIQFAEKLAQDAHEQGVPVFNLSSQAAVVPGIEYMDCSNVSFDATQGAVSLDTKEDNAADQVYLQALRAELQAFDNDLAGLQVQLKSRSSSLPRLFNQTGVLNNSVWDEVKQIDELVAELGESRVRFFMIWGFGYFFETLDNKAIDQITAHELQGYFTAHYKNHLLIIKEIRQTLKVALQKCERRLKEFDSNHLAELVDEWLAVDEYFRIYHMTKLHPELKDQSNYQSVCLRLASAYDALSEKIDAEEYARCKRRSGKSSLIQKALDMFKRGAIEQLKDIQHLLLTDNHSRYPASLYDLVRAYIAELEKDPEQALSAYESILMQEDPELLMPVLKRVLVISSERGDQQQALQAIECLSLLDKTYLKYYAEFLLRTGDTDSALDKLADYHQAYPNDIDNLARIAEIYLDTNHPEQAQELISNLLTEYPDHYGVKRVAQKIAKRVTSH
ncbi:6-hydroxymethylpterin diphosphokinase MptE-like protein [Nitrincola alkalilacustris]|uniref:6-hydroxymethylpterin diphosphokinase MptE-like protein n=1 Tax=Nitrincola alkalilacustris TaxID=1571224 RepID=UPI00145688C0|nr:6-hydroxymethylpterin diphosphokinase MptE-like protein [Nitrincola alkalilacustris]